MCQLRLFCISPNPFPSTYIHNHAAQEKGKGRYYHDFERFSESSKKSSIDL